MENKIKHQQPFCSQYMDPSLVHKDLPTAQQADKFSVAAMLLDLFKNDKGNPFTVDNLSELDDFECPKKEDGKLVDRWRISDTYELQDQFIQATLKYLGFEQDSIFYALLKAKLSERKPLDAAAIDTMMQERGA